LTPGVAKNYSNRPLSQQTHSYQNQKLSTQKENSFPEQCQPYFRIRCSLKKPPEEKSKFILEEEIVSD